jgi:hypothetical protein
MRLTQERLREIVKEELQASQSETIDEGLLNIALDLVGLIPGLGEPADIGNAILYAEEGEWLYAGLSLISIIPAIGDVVGKPGKMVAWLSKKFPDFASFAVKHGPDLIKTGEIIRDNKDRIEKIFKAITEDETISGHLGGESGIKEMEEALKKFIADIAGIEPTEEKSAGEAAAERQETEETEEQVAAATAEAIGRGHILRTVVREELLEAANPFGTGMEQASMDSEEEDLVGHT